MMTTRILPAAWATGLSPDTHPAEFARADQMREEDCGEECETGIGQAHANTDELRVLAKPLA